MSKQTILVIGGAGYIGSHMVLTLLENNYHVLTCDDLSTGHRNAVLGGEFVEGNYGDSIVLEKIFNEHSIDVVMHFAGSSLVAESISDPLKYYQNNVVNTLKLLAAMKQFKVNKLIFSSSAAVYGEPVATPINVNHPLNPINPYGMSKLAVEKILQDCERAYGLQFKVLRYFNAAGADPQTRLGERHNPETHLIPLALRAAMGLRPLLYLYGDDYPTPDGTCVRDYIHVSDLCQAHLLALQQLDDRVKIATYNLGLGYGFSVKQLIGAVEQVVGKKIPLKVQQRREGDPVTLVADPSLATNELGWQPKYTELTQIVADAYAWEKSSLVSFEPKETFNKYESI